MKFSLKNLGVIEEAEVDLADLTIITGKNNSGKTYITYSIYGFLSRWRGLMEKEEPLQLDIQTLLDQGTLIVDLQPLIDGNEAWFAHLSEVYQGQLHRIFATSKTRFEGCRFQAIPAVKPKLLGGFFGKVRLGRHDSLVYEQVPNESQLHLTLLPTPQEISRELSTILQEHISRVARKRVHLSQVPTPFIASCERTGAAIFQKELDLNRNLFLDDLTDEAQLLDSHATRVSDYPTPVRDNLYFLRQLGSLANQDSFLQESHPQLLEEFAAITGGSYTFTGPGNSLQYAPDNSEVRLNLPESSSSVRSLLDLGLYLRHQAQPGDLLMIDEPELNLHPESQRKLARLLVKLLGVGLKVFITTHSDYFLKEFGTILMLSRDNPDLREVAQRYGYTSNEVLQPDQVRVYMTEPASPGRFRLTSCQVSSELGIEAKAFDATIAEMNAIVEAIELNE